ncbi:hypothetical protein [Natranaerofaba carboxydovora]|uniref:hypothetical protein n=1 Tax=Natranaerofaba carboxydovora TaxID=2742683 RepID=UPI001F148D3C|nr:hypothetical protein [Natranaerofaba carboxydovora]UMZ72988.1 hypothetical protein ACONDI_00530 [Natranaerofaba carboxydovora]
MSTTDLEILLNNTYDAMFLIDVENENTFQFKTVNEQFKYLTGLTTAGLQGGTPHDFLDKDTADFITSKLY